MRQRANPAPFISSFIATQKRKRKASKNNVKEGTKLKSKLYAWRDETLQSKTDHRTRSKVCLFCKVKVVSFAADKEIIKRKERGKSGWK